MPRLLRGLVGTAAGLGIIVLAAWLTLQWGILPRADLWRPRLAQWASQAIGMKVQITHIEVLGDLWAPTLRLDGVQLLDPQGRAALQLGRAELRITPGSLIPLPQRGWAPRMDRIVLLDDGHVVEAGTHAELLAMGGLYARFWSRQSGGFIGTEED